jgi:hypothetical protein
MYVNLFLLIFYYVVIPTRNSTRICDSLNCVFSKSRIQFQSVPLSLTDPFPTATNVANMTNISRTPEKLNLDRATNVRATSLFLVPTEQIAKTIPLPAFSSSNWRDSEMATTDFTTAKPTSNTKPPNSCTSWSRNSGSRETNASGGSGFAVAGGWDLALMSVRMLDSLSSTQTCLALIPKKPAGRGPETTTTCRS